MVTPAGGSSPTVADGGADVPPVWRRGDVILGLYEVLDVIQAGGMGLVYRVRHHGWNIELAVKSPRPELVASPKAMRLFEAEAEAWVGLGLYPHTVACSYVRRMDGMSKVFAEWVDGGDLAAAVRDGRLYSGGSDVVLGRLLDVSIQFAWGLHHAHDSGLIHQDVKPANVMLTREGIAKVTDFGLAKGRLAAVGASGDDVLPGPIRRGDGGPTERATLVASFGGLTLAYCSPEQAEAATRGRPGPPVSLTRATDVWSWAVSVLELFAGRLPTRYGPAAGEALEALLRRRDPSTPALPDGLVELLRRCFRPDPAARPRRMDALAAEVAEIYAQRLGRPYPRSHPASTALLADGLSNQALSMLDLGYPERADELWRRALQADPHHPHALYNRGLHRWRTGAQTDARLVADLERARAADRSDAKAQSGDALLALVHFERGDTAQARSLLAEAARSAPDSPEVLAALEFARQMRGRPAPLIRREHAGPVGVVAVSRDGGLIATAADRTVDVWEGDRRLHRLPESPGRVRFMSFAPHGSELVSVTEGGGVQVWDTVTGLLLDTLQREQPPGRGHAGPIAATEDGHVVKWEPGTKRLRVWELRTGYPVRSTRLPFHNVVLSVDGRVALAAAEGTLRLWEAETGRLLRTVDTEPGADRRELAVSGDGRRALARGTLSTDVWDLETGRLLRTLELESYAGREDQVAVSGDGRRALISGLAGVRHWDLDTGRCLRTDAVLAGPSVASVALSADGLHGVVGGSSGETSVWRLPDGDAHAPWSHSRPRGATELVSAADMVAGALRRADALIEAGEFGAAADEVRTARRVPGYERHRELLDRWVRVGAHAGRTGLLGAWQVREIAQTGWGDGMALSPDGRLAMTRLGEQEMGVWDLETGSLRDRLPKDASVSAFVFTPDGGQALIADWGGKVRVWDLGTGRCRLVLTGHRGGACSIAVSGDGRLAVSGDEASTLHVWDLTTGNRVGEIPVHVSTGRVRLAALSDDGRTAFAGDGLSHLCVCDIARGRCKETVAGRSGPTIPFGISRDGRTAVTEDQIPGSRPAGWVWDLHDDTATRRLVPWEPADVLAVGPDGRLGHAACRNGDVTVWDLVAGERIHRLTGHSGRITALAPGAEGRFTLTGGADGTVRIWDLIAGKCLQVLEGHAGGVVDLRLGADSRIAVSRDESGTIRVWEFDWDHGFQER